MPSTPWRAALSLILHRLRLRWRGLHFRLRDAGQVAAEDLIRIDVCWTAAGGLSITDPIRGADFQARGLLLALRAGEPYRIARGLTLEAAYVSTAGARGERRVVELLRAAEGLAQPLDDPATTGLVIAAQGIAAYFNGQWKRGGELCDRAACLLRSRCTGVTWEVDRTTVFDLWSLQFLGELAELGRRWPVVLKEARERGDRYLATNLNTLLISTLRLADDDPDGAEAELRQAMPGILLLIAGYGLNSDDRVVYRALDGEEPVPRRPAAVPQASTPSMGVAEIVSEADLPALYDELVRLHMATPGAGTIADITACPGTDTCKLGISSSRALDSPAAASDSSAAVRDSATERRSSSSACASSASATSASASASAIASTVTATSSSAAAGISPMSFAASIACTAWATTRPTG